MRDIKFRAWDNLEKRMRKVVSLYWQDDKLVSAKLEGENEPIPIKGRLEIEQYAEPILADRLICENTECFLRKPSECFKVVGGESSNA